MAVDKLVDSSQLDADLTSVANAIRTKGGTSASLAFPADFVSAIGAIPSGGGSSVDRGTFTPASNTLSVELTVTRTVVGIMIIAESNPYSAGSGVRCLAGCLYDSYGSVAKINLGSNNAGTSGTVSYGSSSLTVSQSGTTLTVTSANAASNGYFLSGITYRWIAW